MRKNHGFAIMELLIVVVVIAIIATLGVIGYNRWKDANNTQTANTTQPQTTASNAAPQVKTTQDLDAASKALDQATVTSNGADQLASQASAF